MCPVGPHGSRGTNLWLVADHDVILHGVRDAVDSKHQTGSIFDTGEAGSSPCDHVAESVLSVNNAHVRLTEAKTFIKCNLIFELC